MSDTFIKFCDGRVAHPDLVKIRAKEIRAHLASIDVFLTHCQCITLIVQQLGFKSHISYLTAYRNHYNLVEV